jgi:hypothetical protein
LVVIKIIKRAPSRLEQKLMILEGMEGAASQRERSFLSKRLILAHHKAVSSTPLKEAARGRYHPRMIISTKMKDK